MESCIINRLHITQKMKIEMFDIFQKHYVDVTFATFIHDLSKKQFVVLVSEADVIKGFSTIEVYPIQYEHKKYRIIFSGDTVVDQDSWGQQNLAFTWIQFAGAVKEYFPNEDLYWFLIAKGHRTYRYLEIFAKEYYPRCNPEKNSHDLKKLSDYLANMRYPDEYNEETGVIEFAKSQGHLREEFASIPSKDITKTNVLYFLNKNPFYGAGNELVCLTLLTQENLKPMAGREFSKGQTCLEFQKLLAEAEQNHAAETI